MKRLIFILAVLPFLAGCVVTTNSGRVTFLELSNWSPEKYTASRDEAMVVYTAGQTEFSEGHVESAPEYEAGEEPGWVMDAWTALISILPDWEFRFTALKIEWDVLANEVTDE